jgi:hypothetical protein
VKSLRMAVSIEEIAKEVVELPAIGDSAQQSVA